MPARLRAHFGIAQVEAELSELDEEEAKEYLESLGCEEGGLASLVRPAAFCPFRRCSYTGARG